MKNNILLSQFQSFIEKTLFAKPYNKRYEPDQQMLQRVGRKFAVLFFIILLFDTLLDWFLGFIDIVLCLLDLIIQVIEYSLLISLEHWFHFDQQQSETIVVNTTIIIALILNVPVFQLNLLKDIKLYEIIQATVGMDKGLFHVHL